MNNIHLGCSAFLFVTAHVNYQMISYAQVNTAHPNNVKISVHLCVSF